MAQVFEFKRGDTFDLSGPLAIMQGAAALPNLTGWTGRSQIRNGAGGLIAELTFAWIDAAACLMRLRSSGATTGWPLGTARIDIQMTSPTGDVVSTKTETFEIVEDITQ